MKLKTNLLLRRIYKNASLATKIIGGVTAGLILLGVIYTVLPGESIQAQLDRARPGDTILVENGVRTESLILKVSGTASAPITLKCETPLGCTINSGTALTVVTGGRIHYYTLDGFRFIYSGTGNYSIRLGENVWDGQTNKDGGNNGFIIRNCYIEGAVTLYGHNNLIENCEFNGKGVYSNAIWDRYAASHDNTYRNNIIHDYKIRGIWSMQRTDNIIIEGNTIFNIGAGGAAIDCDGAANNQTRCFVRNNIIHDFFGAVGILYENCFDCTAEGNIIYNGREGIGTINYGNTPDSAGYVTEDNIEYRNRDTKLIIKNNFIYNTTGNGIGCYGAPGASVISNTFYKTNQNSTYFGAIGLSQSSRFYCNNWTIASNIFSQPNAQAIFLESGTAFLSGMNINNNFYDVGTTKWRTKQITSEIGYTLPQWRTAFRYDLNSITGNPLFINPGANFSLQANSPACGYGAAPCTSGQTPTPSPTSVPSTMTMLATPSRSPTVTVPGTATIAPSRTPTKLPTKTRTPTPTRSATPTPTATADCEIGESDSFIFEICKK